MSPKIKLRGAQTAVNVVRHETDQKLHVKDFSKLLIVCLPSNLNGKVNFQEIILIIPIIYIFLDLYSEGE